MENTFISNLESVCSSETTGTIKQALEKYNIAPEMVKGIFSSLTDDNDWGIIKMDGERMVLNINDFSDPNKLILDMTVFLYKTVKLKYDDAKNEIRGLYLEHHIDRYGELVGQKEVLKKCLARKNINRETVERELNMLMVKTYPTSLEIKNNIKKLYEHEHKDRVQRVLTANVKDYTDLYWRIEESVVGYLESIKVVIHTLLYLGEKEEVKQLVCECKQFMDDTFTVEITAMLIGASETNNGKHEIWDTYIRRENDYLVVMEERLKQDRFEILLEG